MLKKGYYYFFVKRHWKGKQIHEHWRASSQSPSLVPLLSSHNWFLTYAVMFYYSIS